MKERERAARTGRGQPAGGGVADAPKASPLRGGAATVGLLRLDTASPTAAWESLAPALEARGQLLRVSPGAIYRLRIGTASPEAAAAVATGTPLLPGGAAVRIALRPGPESRGTARLAPAFFAPQAAPVKTPDGAMLLNIGSGGDSIEAFGFDPPRKSDASTWEGYLDCFWADCAPNALVSREPTLLLLGSRGTAAKVKQEGVPEDSGRRKRRALGAGEDTSSPSSDDRLSPPAPPGPPPLGGTLSTGHDLSPPPAPEPEELIDAFSALMIAANDVSGSEAESDREQRGDANKPFFVSEDMTSRLERVVAKAAEQAATRPPRALRPGGDPGFDPSLAPAHHLDAAHRPPAVRATAWDSRGRGSLAEGNPFEEASTLFSSIEEPEGAGAALALVPSSLASASASEGPPSQRPSVLQLLREPIKGSLAAELVWDFQVAAPFLHVSEADRISFVCAVDEAMGRLEAGGGGGDPRHLAMLLSDPRVLDTPLMGTLAGRESFHRALHAVRRAAGRGAASDAVVASLLSAIVAAPDLWSRGEDARAMVMHCCNLCAALGIEPIMVTNDMLLIQPDWYNQLATKALRVGALWAATMPELQCEALFLQACIAFCEQRPEDCAEPLFTAWSLLLNAGLSPSRLEARVLRFLVSVHLYTGKLDMADHFIDRMYWYTETDEDRMVEVDAHMSEFVRASHGKQWDAAVALAQRSLAVLEAMRVPLRQKIVRLYASLVYVLFRARRVTAAFAMYRRMVEYIRSERLHAYGDADSFNITKIWWIGMLRRGELEGPMAAAAGAGSAADLLRTLKFTSFVMRAADPRQTTPQVAHVLWCYADVLAATGKHKGALAALHKCLEAYGRFPEHFPEDSGRMRAVRARLKECAAALEAAEAP